MEVADEELWALLKTWRDGDREAGSAVIDAVFPRVARFFRNKVTRIPDDDDLTQKTLLAISGAAPRSDGTPFWGFIYGVARNVLREYIREKHKRLREQSDFAAVCVHELDPSSMSSVAVRSREVRAFVEALRHLCVADQVLLELRYFEGLKAREIAEILDMPRGSVHRKLESGVSTLRELVAEQLRATGPETPVPTAEALQKWALEVRGRV